MSEKLKELVLDAAHAYRPGAPITVLDLYAVRPELRAYGHAVGMMCRKVLQKHPVQGKRPHDRTTWMWTE